MMKRMNYGLLFLALIGVTIFSCGKEELEVYGCMDNTASNYSTYATTDDGSCMYANLVIYGCTDNLAINYSNVATIDDGSCTYNNIITGELTVNWEYEDPKYKAELTWTSITQDVIDYGAVLVYIGVNGSWIPVPCTFPNQNGYTTNVMTDINVGLVKLWWLDDDFTQPDFPSLSDVKLVIIQNLSLVSESESKRLNISENNILTKTK